MQELLSNLTKWETYLDETEKLYNFGYLFTPLKVDMRGMKTVEQRVERVMERRHALDKFDAQHNEGLKNLTHPYPGHISEPF